MTYTITPSDLQITPAAGVTLSQIEQTGLVIESVEADEVDEDLFVVTLSIANDMVVDDEIYSALTLYPDGRIGEYMVNHPHMHDDFEALLASKNL